MLRLVLIKYMIIKNNNTGRALARNGRHEINPLSRRDSPQSIGDGTPP